MMEQIDVAYTAFENAFEKVPHNRLLSKLKSYGISKIVIDWIRDFLQARKYRVRVNHSYSGCRGGYRTWWLGQRGGGRGPVGGGYGMV